MTSRRSLGRYAAAVAAAGAVVALTSCSATEVTAQRLQSAVGPQFQRLYVVQHQRLGTGVTTRPDGTARCRRTNTSSPVSGAGDDWVCVLNYPFADGHVQPINYDLQVQAGGCYTAAGPTQIVGPVEQKSRGGSTVLNVLAEFDGCFAVD